MKSSLNLGFSIVEIVLVLAIGGLLFGVSYPSYRTYARRQDLIAAARLIKGDLRFAQSQALAGKKPTGCVVLDSYRLSIVGNGAGYRIEAVCSNGNYQTKDDQLFSTGITASPATALVNFKIVGQGTDLSSNLLITLTQANTNSTQTVSVSPTGEIK